MLDSKKWVENQWPSSLFFDPRLHKRVLNIGFAMLSKPTASTPERFSLQKDINHQMLQQ